MRRVPALDRGLAILELLSGRREPMRVAEVAAELDIPRSATYELVHTLRERRYIEQRGDGQISLGPQVFGLGNSYRQKLDIGGAAQEIARSITRRCDETSQVGVLDGREVLYIARADSTRMVRLVSAVGRRIPAHCTAIGKAMLAQLEPAQLDERLAGVVLEALTPHSIVDLEELQRVLADIRRTGVARDDRESNPEVCCVAAPVWDVTGTCVAAISISVPVARMNADTEPLLIDAVRTGAMDLSARLGYVAAVDVSVEEH